jgi:surface protein
MRNLTHIAILVLLPWLASGQVQMFFKQAAAPADTSFITRWNLATAGSGATQLTFSVAVGGTVAYDWEEVSPGSGTGSGTFSASPLLITGLPSGAVIRLKIHPTNFQQIIINNGTDRSRLVDIEQWGDAAWTSMLTAFYGCNNLQASISATDAPIFSGMTTAEQMFRSASAFNSNISSFDISTLTNISRILQAASAFNQDIGGWDVGNVQNFSQALGSATSFNQDIGGWDVSSGTDMSNLFNNTTAFNQDIGGWDVSSVTTMSTMFSNATAFNQDIGAWSPTACTNFGNFMAGKTAANYSAANLASIYDGWTNKNLQTGRTITFNTIKYAASGAPGRALLAGTAATVAVSSAQSNGGLIQITTGAAHGRTTGDKVFITGVTGTTEANGGWLVTVDDSTNITLQGSTFTNAYVSGGTVRTGFGWSITDGGPE